MAASPGADSAGSRRRGRLSRPLVLQTGLELVDDEGLSALTMRRVAERLQVEAMSLYTWVTNRDALLDGIVDRVVDEIYEDPDLKLTPADDWREFLSRLAMSVRRTALRHPRAFPLVATRPPQAPWVRPPLRSLRWIEAFLSTLRSQGFSDEATVYAYRSFTSFLLGFLLLETGAVGTPEGLRVAAPAGLDAAEFPTIAHLSERLAHDRAEQEFQDALVDLLDRIERESAAPAGP